MPDRYPLDTMFAKIENAIQTFPKAAMFELFDRGYHSVFEQLVSCIISIRTLDETTIPISLRLFAEARRPAEMLKLGKERIAELLYGSQYPGQKVETILAISTMALKNGGALPADYDSLTSIKGVGPKCANLALGVSTGMAAISVDVHVHRVVNRWGLIHTKTPEATMKTLEQIIPQKQWVDVNRLLMPFGKNICPGPLPHCSTCPVYSWCERIGVARHR